MDQLFLIWRSNGSRMCKAQIEGTAILSFMIKTEIMYLFI